MQSDIVGKILTSINLVFEVLQLPAHHPSMPVGSLEPDFGSAEFYSVWISATRARNKPERVPRGRKNPQKLDASALSSYRFGMISTPGEQIPHEYRGWWRIVDTSQWGNDDIDIVGTALISLTGYADRLRMFVLLAYLNCKAARTGVSFTWEGAWEYDPVSGSGSVRLSEDGRLTGKIRIKNGDESTFVAEKSAEPRDPIEEHRAIATNGDEDGDREHIGSRTKAFQRCAGKTRAAEGWR